MQWLLIKISSFPGYYVMLLYRQTLTMRIDLVLPRRSALTFVRKRLELVQMDIYLNIWVAVQTVLRRKTSSNKTARGERGVYSYI